MRTRVQFMDNLRAGPACTPAQAADERRAERRRRCSTPAVELFGDARLRGHDDRGALHRGPPRAAPLLRAVRRPRGAAARGLRRDDRRRSRRRWPRRAAPAPTACASACGRSSTRSPARCSATRAARASPTSRSRGRAAARAPRARRRPRLRGDGRGGGARRRRGRAAARPRLRADGDAARRRDDLDPARLARRPRPPPADDVLDELTAAFVALLEQRAALSSASTERSTSSLVVCQFDTEIRIAAGRARPWPLR